MLIGVTWLKCYTKRRLNISDQTNLPISQCFLVFETLATECHPCLKPGNALSAPLVSGSLTRWHYAQSSFTCKRPSNNCTQPPTISVSHRRHCYLELGNNSSAILRALSFGFNNIFRVADGRWFVSSRFCLSVPSAHRWLEMCFI